MNEERWRGDRMGRIKEERWRGDRMKRGRRKNDGGENTMREGEGILNKRHIERWMVDGERQGGNRKRMKGF